jgi:cation diffusion facilitator CzcD-associated flavoprotein CzcO
MESTTQHPSLDCDALVVGAGWAGMYALLKLRELGLRVIVCETGSGVGGTWYWNRYPGARCDVRSVNYSFSFSAELEQEWTWTERYAAQPEIERYANHVADRFDLRRDIRFETRVESAVFDDDTRTWTVTTDGGERLVARYFILATGGYSAPVKPAIPGADTFAGESYLTAMWPQTPVDFAGKRVAVVGTGASGMQTVTAVAHEPIEHMYVFQRTANFAVPAQNGPLDPEYVAALKADYPTFRERARWSGSGTVYEGPDGPVADLPEEEFTARMDEAWSSGGTSVCGGVTDLMSSRAANERVSEYLRRQIVRRVKDPATADALAARGFTLGARRVLVETAYFEAFNQPNVSLVDVRDDPITQVTESGIDTATRHFDVDMIIWALGFDSGTGAALNIDIRGRGGHSLAEHWAGGPLTYLGLMMSGFPNLFSIAGPGSPSIRSNVLVSIEQHVEWIAEFLANTRAQGIDLIEATPEAERAWTEHLNSLVAKSLFAGDDTQYFGANVPGKPRAYLAYIGGVGNYRKICNDVRDDGYEGFVLCAADEDHTKSREWSGPRLDGTLRSRFGSTVI